MDSEFSVRLALYVYKLIYCGGDPTCILGNKNLKRSKWPSETKEHKIRRYSKGQGTLKAATVTAGGKGLSNCVSLNTYKHSVTFI